MANCCKLKFWQASLSWALAKKSRLTFSCIDQVWTEPLCELDGSTQAHNALCLNFLAIICSLSARASVLAVQFPICCIITLQGLVIHPYDPPTLYYGINKIS